MTTAPDDDGIAAFVDGELAPEEAAALAAEAARDPALASRIERVRALRDAAARAFSGAMDEPVPDRLLATVAGTAEVVDLAAARTARAPVRRSAAIARWGAMAASLAVAFLLGRALLPAPAVIASSPGGGLVAQGALAGALDRQLASSQPADAAVKTGVSFQAADGDYCRTFTLRQARPVAGLACHDASGWQVRVAAQSAPLALAGGYQTAGDETPAPVLDAMDQIIRGQPLDAAGEARARAEGWKAPK